METLFLKLLNMSIAAGWLVLAVIVLRMLLKKAPKSIRCFLWALVAFRLICPFSFESVISLIPSVETVPEDIMYVQQPELYTGIPVINNAVNPVFAESFAPTAGDSVNPLQVVTYIASIVWLAGLVAMILYAAFSYIRIYRKVAASMQVEDNLFICDYIDTPFILGMIKPKIYIPSALTAEQAGYGVAHEKAHLKRLDHWWKPFGFALLAVYWFNPVIWIAYILLCRDIEFACDERVIKELGETEKKSYSETLLLCSIPRKMIVACPLAFGEVGVKERVKTVLHYKKPAFWIIVAAVIVCVIVAVCFLTNPKEDRQDMSQQTSEEDSPESSENSEDIVSENNNQDSPEELLTMERLIELCESGSEVLAAELNYFDGQGSHFSNFEVGETYEGVLNWTLDYTLPYEGKEYRLQVSYWRPATAEKYGHEGNELESIYIRYPEVGASQLLYTTESEYMPNLDIQSFLDREYDMSMYLTLALPEGLSLGTYQMHLNTPWQGSVFVGDYEVMPHGDTCPEALYAPGGVGVAKWDVNNPSRGALFENGKLYGFEWHFIERPWVESEGEIIEGCSMQAVICEQIFTLFSAPEGQEYWEKNGMTYEEFLPLANSYYWYIFFAEPDSEYVYTLFLNQKYFSKEDAIAMARTVEFAEMQGNDSGSNEAGDGRFVLDEQDKNFLRSMCYYMPDWSDYDSLNEEFWEDFLFASFTSPVIPGDGTAKTIGGEAEYVTVYREDLGFREGQVKISKDAVAQYVKLVLGCELPTFEPAFEDMEHGRTALYYKDGYYYIGVSDFGSEGYTFKECRVQQDDAIYATVTYEAYVDEPGNVVGTVTFTVAPADNQNGFTVISKKLLRYT